MIQAKAYRAIGKGEVVLDPREPLFFGGRDECAVLHERRRRVVEVTRDPEDVHQN